MNDLRAAIRKILDVKVNLEVRWILWIILACLILGAFSLARYKSMRLPEASKITNQIVNDYNVRRHFDGRAWGTFWDYCGVTLTADHVPAGMPDDGEAFIGRSVHRSAGIIDAAWYGRKWRCRAPRNPEPNMQVYIVGYPGGSPEPTIRQGKVYIRRPMSGSPGYELSTWIVVFDQALENASEPVVGGMSGGIVTDHDFNPVGILVTQNSPSDLNGDGQEEQSSDITGLLDAYRALIE